MSINPLDIQTNGETCPVWIDSRDDRCGRTDLIDGRWCKRHTPVMSKRIREARRLALPSLSPKREAEVRARIDAIDAELARRTDVQPCTGWKRSRLNDANVAAVAELNRERAWLVMRLGGEAS